MLYCAVVAWFWFPSATSGQDRLQITEFLAANTRVLADEDGETSDWVEIHNPGPVAVNLLGWTLTDRPASTRSQRWAFPATNLPPNAYLLVWASGKDRRMPGAPLHTNFRLSQQGEALGLYDPLDRVAEGSLLPSFPPQVENVSYGLGRTTADTVLIEEGDVGFYAVPTGPAWLDRWTLPGFLDGLWPAGPTPLGYDARTPGPLTFHTLLKTDLRSKLLAHSATLYLRMPFVVPDPAQVEDLTLEMLYPDGFIAYVNGVAGAGENLPRTLAWNSTAPVSRDPVVGLRPVAFPMSLEAVRGLRAGTNWLAIQALGSSPTNAQFILRPRLIASRATSSLDAPRYFTTPSPGKPNTSGTLELGPVLHHLSPPPEQLRAGDPVRVQVKADPTFGLVAGVELHYRVMFGAEVTLPMRDDGRGGDALARDGLFTAVIPGGAAAPGEMLRWYVTARDLAGHLSRLPEFQDPTRSPEYVGGVIASPPPSQLPLIQLFVDPQGTNQMNTLAGTRCAVGYLGELYDNVGIHIRGTTSEAYFKKSYKLDFNPGAWFRHDPALPRVEEINLNTTWSDKAYIRTVLSWETYREAGVAGSLSFLARVHLNGRFYELTCVVEEPDRTMLERNGLNPAGSLFKMYTDLTSAEDNQKVLPPDGSLAELRDLVQGIASSNPGRVAYLYDQVDLPAVVNYLAAGALIHDNDAVAKNYYVYRDPAGTAQWRILPWDKDLTFGRNFQRIDPDLLWATADTAAQAQSRVKLAGPSHPFYGDFQHQKYDGLWNQLIDQLYQLPEVRAMYTRRLRTLMDLLLQPPGTPRGELKYERRLEEFLHLAQADAEEDHKAWGYYDWGADQDMGTALWALESQYLVPRRQHFYVTHSVTNTATRVGSALIPEPQSPGLLLDFGQIDRAPASGDREQQFVEVVNPQSEALDVSGWEIRGTLRHRFPPGTVIPAGMNLYLTPNLQAFRRRTVAPLGRAGLFVQGNYDGRLDSRGGYLQVWDGNRLAGSTVLEDAATPAQAGLRIVRIMYHPSDPELEYLELAHEGTTPLDLRGIRFTRGIRFEFSGGSVLELPAPGNRQDPARSVLVVRNRAAFERHHGPEPRIAGEYQGSLDNSGEPLRLEDARGEPILEFAFSRAWLPLTDGVGFPMVHPASGPAADWGEPGRWRMGPWEVDPGPLLPPLPITPPGAVYLNEILARPLPGDPDAVELFAPADADIGGWFLSDDFSQPRKYRIPGGTRLKAGEYRVFTAAEFGESSAGGPGFRFSASGDEAALFSASAEGRLTGWAHRVRFGGSDPGAAIGRYVDALGREQWMREESSSLGTTNSTPVFGPLVFSRLHYHPAPVVASVDNQRDEFIELHNVSEFPVGLSDPAPPFTPWELQGEVTFRFPPQARLPAGGRLVVVGFDPAEDPTRVRAFRARFALPPTLPILGPWEGSLGNGGGRIGLSAPLPGGSPPPGWVEIDSLVYGNAPPWPLLADGQGACLTRLDESVSGLEATNWIAAAPLPGQAVDRRKGAPTLLIEPGDARFASFSTAVLSVVAGDEASLRYQWRHAGEPLPMATDRVLQLEGAGPRAAGLYDVVVMGAGGARLSTAALLTAETGPTLYTHPLGGVVTYQSNFLFRVTADGLPPLSYQWRLNGTDLPGATQSELLLTGADPSKEGMYSVVVSDGTHLGVESRPAPLSIIYRPVILTQPDSWQVMLGQTFLMSISVTGTGPFAYFWRKDGVNTRAPSLPFLLVTNAQLTNAGVYTVGVSNRATPRDRVFSEPASVVVVADSDGDGMPDLWELEHGFDSHDPSDGSADADGDGISNRDEFLSGTNPRDPFDFPKIDRIERVKGLLREALLRFAAASNRSYTLQVSDHPGPPWSNWLSFRALPTNRLLSVPVELAPEVPQRQFRLVSPRVE